MLNQCKLSISIGQISNIGIPSQVLFVFNAKALDTLLNLLPERSKLISLQWCMLLGNWGLGIYFLTSDKLVSEKWYLIIVTTAFLSLLMN